MNDVASLTVALLAGIFLGALFFGGLWWTVRKGLSARHPAWWFFASTLLRVSGAVAGFYFVSHGDWRRWVVCLLGFLIARAAVTRLTRDKEGMDAP